MLAPNATASQLLQIALDALRTDGGTQARVRLDEDTLATYGEALAAGATFPDVVVFCDGVDNWLADGFHRVETYRRAGRATINALVRPGTRRDAILYAAGANGRHGLPRTREDKRRAVLLLLADPEWRGWADREIARTCNVSAPFVARLRNPVTVIVGSENTAGVAVATSSAGKQAETPAQQRTYRTRHGTTAMMHVRHKPPLAVKGPPVADNKPSVPAGSPREPDVFNSLPEGATITLRRCGDCSWHGQVTGDEALVDVEAGDVPRLMLAIARQLLLGGAH
jgi:hypothetical protein